MENSNWYESRDCRELEEVVLQYRASMREASKGPSREELMVPTKRDITLFEKIKLYFRK